MKNKSDGVKLVRDTIPQIIKQSTSEDARVIVADDTTYLFYLLKKIVEEAKEVQRSEDKQHLTEELADVKEVVLALTKFMQITENEIEKVRQTKKKKNGGFEKRFILYPLDNKNK